MLTPPLTWSWRRYRGRRDGLSVDILVHLCTLRQPYQLTSMLERAEGGATGSVWISWSTGQPAFTMTAACSFRHPSLPALRHNPLACFLVLLAEVQCVA